MNFESKIWKKTITTYMLWQEIFYPFYKIYCDNSGGISDGWYWIWKHQIWNGVFLEKRALMCFYEVLCMPTLKWNSTYAIIIKQNKRLITQSNLGKWHIFRDAITLNNRKRNSRVVNEIAHFCENLIFRHFSKRHVITKPKIELI